MNYHHTKHQRETMTPAWEYRICRKQYSHPDLGTYYAYDLYAFAADHTQTHPTAIIHDITTVQTLAEQIAEQCNRYQLSPIHLEDFIADYLARIS